MCLLPVVTGSAAMTRFLLPDAQVLAETDHAGMARVPVLFDADFGFRTMENRYLRERANREWPQGKRRALADNTLISLGRRLQHFAEWRDLNATDLGGLSYADIERYEDDQRLGREPYARPVTSTTATLRADVATDFLVWAIHHGHCRSRPVEFVETWRKVRSGQSSVTPWVRVRKRPGRSVASDDPRRRPVLRVPEVDEVVAWLRAVRRRRGQAKYLICRFMVQTGVRLDEAVSLTVDQWPSTDDIERSVGKAPLYVTLTRTKGMVRRTITVPLALARNVRRWIDGNRLALAVSEMDRTHADALPDRLFLSDRAGYEGMPIERHTVYDAFREVTPRPEGWHPHKARHAFTCHYMRSFVLKELGPRTADAWPQFVQSRGEFALQVLQAQLGHVSDRTTQVYLRHLRSVFGLERIQDEYHDRLDRDEDE